MIDHSIPTLCRFLQARFDICRTSRGQNESHGGAPTLMIFKTTDVVVLRVLPYLGLRFPSTYQKETGGGVGGPLIQNILNVHQFFCWHICGLN